MTTKAQKDTKPFTPAPRLLPRQTAASAARAARNATNRNLTQPAMRRPSPPHLPPTPIKVKTQAPRPQKAEYKADEIKTIAQPDPERLNESPPAEHNPYIVEVSSSLTIDEIPDESLMYGCGRTIPEISESDFENEMKQNDGFPMEYPTESYIQQQTPRTEDKSRPQTPCTFSRPQTPKSMQSSRPQTPAVQSRPTTPANPTQRHGTPTSRPNTPQRLPPSRSRTPASMHSVPTARVLSPSSISNQPQTFNEDDDLKSTYIMKQKQYQRMKKELDLKQHAILEIFDNLRGLRERMTREGISGGGEGITQQELVVFNVGDWAAEEVSQLCREADNSTVESAAELINTSVVIDECALADLDNKVLNVPSHFADLCLQAFTARQEIIDWVKELIEKKENGDGEMLERIAQYNTQGLELCDTLRELKSRADDAVDTVTQLSKRACRERAALIAVGESLVREVARLRQDLETRTAVINEIKEQTDAENNKFEELRRELEEERSLRNVIKDKLATTESQLRQARNRVAKMDRQLRESEASISSLTGTVKTLEDQSRQKEVQLEARARKLKESLKTGEVASSHLAQQRDALQAEVQELKQEIDSLQTQYKATVQDLNNQLKEMNNNLEEQRQIIAKEVELKEAAQGELRETQNYVEELKAKITELDNLRPNPDLPSEREMDLWAELQATKDTLRLTEEEVATCKKEKVRFLESLTKITESDNKAALQQKLTTELLSKEEIIGKMQTQLRELTKNLKLNEQKVIQYAQYVSDLQAHNRAVANCQEAPNGISYQDLQQEIMNLRMGLLEAVHRNEELAEVLVQKEQQLEQQDKTSRAQARVIKLQVAQVREELINMLKNKETEQSRELAALQQDLEHRMKIVDEVNKQIAAKADEIQELFVTLENKQQQTHRLEKIVLALEEQQRRAQAQRTRHEEKIASLEHELASNGHQRERKFIFF